MGLRKREVKKEENLLWTYQGERPVFLVPVDGSLQWLDGEGFHVGETGGNEGVIKKTKTSKDALGKILSTFMDKPLEEGKKSIDVFSKEIKGYPEGTKVFYTYEDGVPVLEDDRDDEEVETFTEEVQTPQAAEVKEVQPPQVEEVSSDNDYTKVSRQMLLHHLRKHEIKVRRGLSEDRIVEVLQKADKEDWDAVKADEGVTSLKGELCANTLTNSVATEIVREVAAAVVKDAQERETVTATPKRVPQNGMKKAEEPLEETKEEGGGLTLTELMEKAKGYTWQVSLDDLEPHFGKEDFKILSCIYGSKDDEEVAFRVGAELSFEPWTDRQTRFWFYLCRRRVSFDYRSPDRS